MFISESMCIDNRRLAYKCRQLKNAGKIHATWFFNNTVNIKLTEDSNPLKILYAKDIENQLQIDNPDDYINNFTF